MALKLHIPTLKENPIIIADTQPQKISQSIAKLQTQHPLDIASHLHIELEILNRQKVSPNHRIQALDAYRPMLITTTQALAEDYCNSTLPLHDKAKLASTAVESLWVELGYGYKLALIDLQNQLIKLGKDKSSAHAIQRAMHAIGEHALVYYQTYLTPPDHIWGDLHQLYFCAVQLGIQNLALDTDKSLLEIDDNLDISIESTYKHALLMSLADPQHLTQRDIRLIANFLAYHVNDAQITAVIPLDTLAGAFIISLKSNNPPVPYSKQKVAPNPNTDVLLQTMGLVRIIHQHLSSLLNKELPKDGSIPDTANLNDYIDLLTYLIKHWGVIPKRVFNRSPKNGELDLVTGIAAIHHVSDNKPIASTMARHADEFNQSHPLDVRPSRWQILNISAIGMSVRRHPTAEKNISIGSLLGIKSKDEHHWSIGLVRWASCDSNDRLDMGVQLIAPHAQSAFASIEGRKDEEMVLLLPEIAAVKQAASIIAPRGTFEPAHPLVLSYKNQRQHITLTKLIERTHYFERIQFSVLN